MVARSSAPSSSGKDHAFPHEYLIAEDEVGDSVAQTILLTYLGAVLAHLYRDAGWFVARNLTFFHPAIQNSQYLISPDIAVFVGLALTRQEQRRVTSWEMRPAQAHAQGHPVRPSPTVIIEVSSGSTWKSDIGAGEKHKPWLYGQMGAREYFAYDPNDPPVWRAGNRQRLGRRLLGWRYDEAGLPQPQAPDEQGRLWSEALDSWLSPDEELLRLYDSAGALRLTADEAAAAEAEAAVAQARSTVQQADRMRLQGEAQGRREALLLLLRERFGAVPDPVAARIQTIADSAALDALLIRAVRVERLDQLFGGSTS
jgi:Uma2 family endonuclease